MTDVQFPDRVTQLRQRWDADPSSRVFLQLAEEYRHLGRLQEALGVLDAGLKEHPGYLSALVAKGRCHLELGQPEAARGVLERVVRQDATQMVANKLLVRAYLDAGEADRARERLDLYSLINDSDPEIADLRAQIRRLETRGRQDEPFPDLAPVPAAAPPPPAGGDVFDLGQPAPARRAAEAQDVFELGFPAPAAPARPEPLEAPAEAAPEDGDQPFPGLATRSSRDRYLEALAAEGIFAFDAPAPAAAEEPAPAAGVFDLFEAEPLPEELEVLPELEAAPAPVAAEAAAPPAEVVELTAMPEVAEEPAPAGEPATVTLGELYLRQGHLAEAERLFAEVLEREPDNPAAQAGLAAVAARRGRPLETRDLLASFRPQSGDAGPRARKAFLLTSYLERLRRGRDEGDVPR